MNMFGSINPFHAEILSMKLIKFVYKYVNQVHMNVNLMMNVYTNKMVKLVRCVQRQMTSVSFSS